MTPTVGFVGVGRIGELMVQRLAGAGVEVSFYSRRPEVVRRLQAVGAQTVDGPVDLATQEIVISCLYSDVQLLEVAPGIIDAMAPDGIFVSHTTGTLDALAELHVTAKGRSVGIVDAGFSGSAEKVRSGALTLFLGGTSAHVTRIDVLKAYASILIHAGPLGAGMRMKVLNNLLFAATSQSTLSALESASKLGIDESSALRALGAGSAANAAAELIGACGGSDAFMRRVEPYLRKDVEVASMMAAGLEVDISALLTAAAAGPMVLTGVVGLHPAPRKTGVNAVSTSGLSQQPGY